MELLYRLAIPSDLPFLISMYRRATAKLHAQGISQWSADYPNAAWLAQDVERKEMYVLTQQRKILGAVTVNEQLDWTLSQGIWEVNSGKIGTVHRFCVDPFVQHQGIGAQMLRLMELEMQNLGYASIRLDAFQENPYSMRLYRNAGYHENGIVHRDGLVYVLFEKVFPRL